MTDAALFDWDGTLLDSRGALLGAWHAASAKVVGRCFPQTPDEERLVFTLPGRQLFPQVAGSPEGGAALAEVFQHVYLGLGRRVRTFKGVPEMLRELRASGMAIAVVTSKARERFEVDAERCELTRLVDVAVCAGDTRAHKPDPEPMLRALDLLGVAPDDAVAVGDTEVDIVAAHAAGVPAIGVAWGPLGPRGLLDAGARVIVRSPGELAHTVTEVPERIGA